MAVVIEACVYVKDINKYTYLIGLGSITINRKQYQYCTYFSFTILLQKQYLLHFVHQMIILFVVIASFLLALMNFIFSIAENIIFLYCEHNVIKPHNCGFKFSYTIIALHDLYNHHLQKILYRPTLSLISWIVHLWSSKLMASHEKVHENKGDSFIWLAILIESQKNLRLRKCMQSMIPSVIRWTSEQEFLWLWPGAY